MARREATAAAAPAAAKAAPAAAPPPIRLTARVATGRALRSELEKANQLRGARKPAQAPRKPCVRPASPASASPALRQPRQPCVRPASPASASPALRPPRQPCVRIASPASASPALRPHRQPCISIASPAQAAAVLARLAAESKPHSDSLEKLRALELRDALFSVGDLKLTQHVVARFLEMPAVRQVLPAELQKLQRQAADAETSQLLLETAKAFFTDIFALRGKRGRGRRSDVDRNAFAAAAAALLPADLLKNRRGRAAMRLLGLSYRQVKAGSAKRRELEDHGASPRAALLAPPLPPPLPLLPPPSCVRRPWLEAYDHERPRGCS